MRTTVHHEFATLTRCALSRRPASLRRPGPTIVGPELTAEPRPGGRHHVEARIGGRLVHAAEIHLTDDADRFASLVAAEAPGYSRAQIETALLGIDSHIRNN